MEDNSKLSSASLPDDEAALPPYTDELPHNAVASSALALHQPIPSILSFYSSKNLFKRESYYHFHLGTQEDNHLFHLSISKDEGTNGLKKRIALHNGPNKEDAVIAETGERPGEIHPLEAFITLPPIPGSSATCTEPIVKSVNRRLDTTEYRFSMDVPVVDKWVREDFVWRQCKGDKKKEHPEAGWKNDFVLIKVPAHSSTTASANADVEDDGEVVAVVAEHPFHWYTDVFRIQFQGQGLKGDWGERWAVAALITGVKVEMDRMQGASRVGVVKGQENGFIRRSAYPANMAYG